MLVGSNAVDTQDQQRRDKQEPEHNPDRLKQKKQKQRISGRTSAPM